MAVTQQEAKLWLALQRQAPGFVRLTRVEVRHPAGFPDVMWWTRGSHLDPLFGFLELKDEVDEIRPQQRIFLRQAAQDGRCAFVLVRRRGELFLIDPRVIGVDCRLMYHPTVATKCESLSEVWERVVYAAQ